MSAQHQDHLDLVRKVEEIIAPLAVADWAPAATGASRSTALRLLLCSDFFTLSLSLAVGELIDETFRGRVDLLRCLAVMAYVPVLLASIAAYGLYRRSRRRILGSSFPDFGSMVHSLLVGGLLTYFVSVPAQEALHLPVLHRLVVVVTVAFGLVAMVAGRAATRSYTARSPHARSRILIVGSGIVASAVTARLGSVNHVQVVGCVDDHSPEFQMATNGLPCLGSLEELPSIVEAERIDHVVVAFSGAATGSRLSELLRPSARRVRISVVPRLFDLMTVRSQVDELFGLPVIDVAPGEFGLADRVGKRLMDVVGSALILALLSPLLVAIGLAIRITSPGPALFRQERTGRNGVRFRICKFRTMYGDAEARREGLGNDVDGPLFKNHDDPRVTPLGRILRRTSLDELPQLLNVLRGDMSLVGPRPFVTSESDEIGGWAARRLDVRPGMTGLWQISGRNDLPFEELCRLDYCYVTSWSLWWDLRILWHTPAMAFRRKGAY
jgi:exopolysaccharide biosynthesis polyprenyl glycosylphosphotransferase